MMSSSQQERGRLKRAAKNGDIEDITALASSGVDVINADVSSGIGVSKYYMLYLVIMFVVYRLV